MNNCPRCGAPLTEGSQSCPSCGADLSAAGIAPGGMGPAPDAGFQYQQQDYQQHNYQQPPMPQPMGFRPPAEQPISIGEWFLMQLVLAIPLVNLIMLFIWGFSSETPETKANFAKAQLIWMAIGFVISVLLVMLIGTMFAAFHGALD